MGDPWYVPTAGAGILLSSINQDPSKDCNYETGINVTSVCNVRVRDAAGAEPPPQRYVRKGAAKSQCFKVMPYNEAVLGAGMRIPEMKASNQTNPFPLDQNNAPSVMK